MGDRELAGDSRTNTEGCPDGDIDMTAKNNHGHSDGGDADIGGIVKDVDEIPYLSEARVEQRDSGKDNDERQNQHRFLLVQPGKPAAERAAWRRGKARSRRW